MGRYKWSDLITNKNGVDVSVTVLDTGLVRGVIGNETVFECTPLELKLMFAMISRFLGKKESKKLINIKRTNTEKWS